ncbi:3-oxoacyl-[acyl-carrier-protein] synthase-3 [Microbacterium trichothecenolyticum]|uniref:3-oxoacyl-ACP synthase III family protein n=1 Tax=Microbacterium trichothecenolyticum TaxID=69370 RepID=UPI00286781BD|nr:3-oxoacyl-[acyl-carrier-protein] synthase III C-terminal domain-containing protein [Microbacterium trichothecenolyticum]MDR7185325.1 3-oxoacyl-[acyl-carrier-protein] synthase-3 [Microbacterium trichothecenolyticum]
MTLTQTPGAFARVTAIEALPLSGTDADANTSDLAAAVAARLLERADVPAATIDFLILCTETPDFALPTTACMVQTRLGIPRDVGALDIIHGAAGFAYGLGLAKALIESGQADRVLVVTADTRGTHGDRFEAASGPLADGATATLVEKSAGDAAYIAGVSLGTDGNDRSSISGSDQRASALVSQVLAAAGASAGDVDVFLLHALSSPEAIGPDIHSENVVLATDPIDTGSSAIPTALADAVARGRLSSGSRVVIAGLDDGVSWGGALLTW